MSTRTTEHATFTIERSYAATPERVFAAWAEPEQKNRWFGTREGGIELDFRPGGSERFAAEGPDGAQYTYAAVYKDIVPGERIVYTYEMHRDEQRLSVSVSTVELRAAEGGTALTYTEQGVFLDGHDTAAAREHGTREILGHLAGEVEGVTRDNRWAALYVLCGGMLMIVLDVTVVNVALPSIQEELHFSSAALAWVVNAYLIAFGGLLLLAGRIGDLVGRRRVFLAGIALFTVSSLVCGLADSRVLLVGARFVQGVGGAMTSAVILGMIVTMFPEAREQAKAIGVYAFVASGGGSVGLLAGGVITQSIDWHWIFFINVPLGIVTALLARRMLEDDRGIGLSAGADVPGALLITSALMLGVYTIVGPAAEHGWGAGSTLALGAASLALLAAFVAREAKAANPLMPLRIFRSRPVAAANTIQILSVAGMFGMFFLGALYLRRVLGYDALEIGLAFLPATLGMGTLSIRYTERLVMRFGARRALLAGLPLIAVALALLARVPLHGTYLADVFPSMTLLGIGAGLAFPALMTVAMSGSTPQDAGLASGLVNTTAQVGGALGLAVLATLSASRTHALTHAGEKTAAALTGGYHLAFWIAAALVLASIAVAALALPRGAQQAAHAAAAERGAEDGPRGAGAEPAESRAA